MPNPSGNAGVNMSSDLTFITNEQGQHLGDRCGVLLGDNTRSWLACAATASPSIFRPSQPRSPPEVILCSWLALSNIKFDVDTLWSLA